MPLLLDLVSYLSHELGPLDILVSRFFHSRDFACVLALMDIITGKSRNYRVGTVSALTLPMFLTKQSSHSFILFSSLSSIVL